MFPGLNNNTPQHLGLLLEQDHLVNNNSMPNNLLPFTLHGLLQNSGPTNISDQATLLPEAFQTMNLQDPTNSGWYMDTGATNHLSAGIGNLHNVFNKRPISSILVGDGSHIPVTNTGHIILPTPHLPLHLHKYNKKSYLRLQIYHW